MLRSRPPQAAACLLAIALLACGGKDAETDTVAADSTPTSETAETQPASTENVQAAAGNPIAAPLTREDIARWEKGMEGELKAIEAAAGKIKTARSGEDTLSAMMGVQEMATVAAAAQAAGMEQERYKFVRSNLSAVVSYLTPAQGGIDTTMLSQAQRDEMRQMNEARIQQMQNDVPADVVEALRPRAAELKTKEMQLAAARLKGAGMQ